MAAVITNKADAIKARLKTIKAIIDRKTTKPEERDAAKQAYTRLADKLQNLDPADFCLSDADMNTRYYRLPEVRTGYRYAQHQAETAGLPWKERFIDATKLRTFLRADIKARVMMGKKLTKAGTGLVLAGKDLSDPFENLPEGLKIMPCGVGYSGHVKKVNLKIKGIPADWWTEVDGHYPGSKVKKPTARFQALIDAIEEILWAWNYDGSDAQVDYFDVHFYKEIRYFGEGLWEYGESFFATR